MLYDNTIETNSLSMEDMNMKKWNEAEIVELNIAETADGKVPGLNEGYVFNDDIAEAITEFIQEVISGLN